MRHIALSYSLPLTAAALLVFSSGCDRGGVKVYKVDSSDTVATTPPPVVVTPPKMPAGMPSAMPASMPGNLPAPDNSGLPRLKYTLPAGWTEKAATQMRVASFDIAENGKTVDVSVIPLGGLSGDVANLNRWRGQVGQPAQDETELKKAAEPVQVGSLPANLYDIAGTSPGSGESVRIIGVILHTEETVWYFKMMGDAPLAEKNKAAFVELLKSVEFVAPAPAK
jgi:hypothetical protein